MLTRSDIEFIKKSREEIIENRTDPIILYHNRVIGEDKLTGDPIYEQVEEEVSGTWRTYISQSPGTDDRQIIDGVVADIGDVFAEFGLDVNLDDVDKVKHVPTGTYWSIKGVDLVGIGEPNRQYVLLGRTY